MSVTRSIVLFILAAAAEIGGAWLICRAFENTEAGSGWGPGIALGAYGFVATLQPDANFGRILAAYGGIFVAGSRRGEWHSTVSGLTGGTSPAR